MMDRNGYLVSPLQVENKFKSLTRSYKNMISNNKKTGRGRATCKFEAELTDLFAKKHNITPLALSGRNGLVLREDQNSEKENNASMKSRARRTTTENLKECLVAIESFTSEMKTERESFHNMQVQMLEEYKNIKKLHEDYINSATERWAAASAQREERNKILKEISKNCSDKEIFL
ncbi:uncharacterized protein [Temnothorax nylanderi]|uniref:uncharacterized protein n=1 Tax=Temnothorax nylanderi TaxID=102681 RepID=UPI003A8526A4